MKWLEVSRTFGLCILIGLRNQNPSITRKIKIKTLHIKREIACEAVYKPLATHIHTYATNNSRICNK